MIAREGPTAPADTALGEAAAWRLLGLLFERPRAGWWEEVEAVGREVDDAELKEAAAAAAVGATEAAHLAVFGPAGAVSPREVAYRGLEDPARVLSDLVAFYEAFAYRPASEEPPDHVSVEAGFLGFLKLKEAYARSCRDLEAARAASAAFERFAREHMGPFARALREKLGDAPAAERLHFVAASALVARLGRAAETASKAASVPDAPD